MDSDWTKPWHETPTTDVFWFKISKCLGWKPLPSSHHRFFSNICTMGSRIKNLRSPQKTRKGNSSLTQMLNGIFTFIYPQNYPNIDKCTIHLAHLLLVINIGVLYPIPIWCLNEKMKSSRFPGRTRWCSFKNLGLALNPQRWNHCCRSRISNGVMGGTLTNGPLKKGVTAVISSS